MATRKTTKKATRTPRKQIKSRKTETSLSEIPQSRRAGVKTNKAITFNPAKGFLSKIARPTGLNSRPGDRSAGDKPGRKTAIKKFVLPLVVIVIVGLVIYLAMTRLVIAWVDRKPIWWFAYYSQLNGKYGDNLKQQLINEQLVEDEAANRHVSANQQEVNSQLQTIITQEGGQSNLDAILTQQGLTMDELKHQIMLQILVNKMFGQNIAVTDDEVNKYLEDNKSQFPDVNDAVKSQVKSQLKQQKVIEAFQAWLAQAEKSKRVIKTQ